MNRFLHTLFDESIEFFAEKAEITDVLVPAYNRKYLSKFFTSLTDFVVKRSMNEDYIERMEKCCLALFMLDFNGFKTVNDTYGHSIGDEILIHGTKIFKDCFRQSDIIVRYGGDEFVFLLLDTSNNKISAITERVLEKLNKLPYEVPGKNTKIYIQPSIGICTFSLNQLLSVPSWKTFLEIADAVMYYTKNSIGMGYNLHEFTGNMALETTPFQFQQLQNNQNPKLGMAIRHQRDALGGIIDLINVWDGYSKQHAIKCKTICMNFLRYLLDNEKNPEIKQNYNNLLLIASNYRTSEVLSDLVMYHDVGKAFIERTILGKTTALSKEEWTFIHEHVDESKRLLSSLFKNVYVPERLCAEELFCLINGVSEHHERWDGSGYPSALKGQEISQIGRLVAIVSAFASMTSERPYSDPRDIYHAVSEIENALGKQFDPVLGKLFIHYILAEYALEESDSNLVSGQIRNETAP